MLQWLLGVIGVEYEVIEGKRWMLTVYKKKKQGSLAVAWTWFPFFIADDRELIKKVDQELKDKFAGMEITEELLTQMHLDVIEMVCEKYKISGLRAYLQTIAMVQPDAEELLEQIRDGEETTKG